MATLLHLSDLHLGNAADEVLGDHKLEVVARDSRQRRSTVLAATLRSLGEALVAGGETLDTVVVSGDVTYRGTPAGFDDLNAMLTHLGDALPDRARILVVPGNHDVTWGTKPGTRERYEHFLHGVRDAGYLTPLLEGVDLDRHGRQHSATESPVLVAPDRSFALIGLNSSDHCGVEARTEDTLTADIDAVRADTTNAAAQSLLRAWQANNLYDVARISDEQRVSASRALSEAIPPGDSPIRIAVLHHQLLPISLEEEVKPFESIVNLSQVRDWLANNKIDMVLHGHKHVAVAYEDRYIPLVGSGAMHRLVVSSVGTVGLGQLADNVIGRLITTDAKRPSLGKVIIRDVRSMQPGTPIRLDTLPATSFRIRVKDPDHSLIQGNTSSDVHEQLLDLTDAGQSLRAPLMCRVLDPQGAEHPPTSYRSLESVPDTPGWFEDMVSLWQSRERLQAMPFNHGERIFAMDGFDQFDRAVATLATSETSSRAVISVFDPRVDTEQQGLDFPSFCLVHLVIVDDELRVVAYFRKQEMRYWWSVNLAELAQLQSAAVRRINEQRTGPRVKAGSLTTVTAVPTSGDRIPRVAVPLVDRWVDRDTGRLLRMALLPYQPLMAEADAALADWAELRDECDLPAAHAADGSPVPALGLERIRSHLNQLRSAFGTVATATRIDTALQLAILANTEYRRRARSADSTHHAREQVHTAHAELEACVAELEVLVASSRSIATMPAPDGSAGKAGYGQ